MRDRASNLLSAVLIAALAAVATALVSQYVFDMQPCAWCVLQRLIFLCIAAASALALWSRLPFVRAGLGAAILLLAMSGIASALYQHFVAAHAASCRLSLAERIIRNLRLDTLAPEVFGIRVGCSGAATTMLGIPYEFWSLAMFAIIALVVAAAVRGRQRRAGAPT